MIYCDNCEYVFTRKTEIFGLETEEYNNIFGTFCPKCNHFIKPDKDPEFVKKNKEKKENLKNIFLKKMKNKLFGD